MKLLAFGALLALIQAQGPFFTTPLSIEEMATKQALVKTTMGNFVIEFLPEVAPNHVGLFLEVGLGRSL